MKVYRWNSGRWHKLIGYDPSFKDLSANVWLACGCRDAGTKPEEAELSDKPTPLCKKCFPDKEAK